MHKACKACILSQFLGRCASPRRLAGPSTADRERGGGAGATCTSLAEPGFRQPLPERDIVAPLSKLPSRAQYACLARWHASQCSNFPEKGGSINGGNTTQKGETRQAHAPPRSPSVSCVQMQIETGVPDSCADLAASAPQPAGHPSCKLPKPSAFPAGCPPLTEPFT